MAVYFKLVLEGKNLVLVPKKDDNVFNTDCNEFWVIRFRYRKPLYVFNSVMICRFGYSSSEKNFIIYML